MALRPLPLSLRALMLSLATLLWAAPALADLPLLAKWDCDFSFGGHDPSDISFITMEFGYNDGTTLRPPCEVPRIGCAPIPIGEVETGSNFDYNAFNSPAWAQVYPLLTDFVGDEYEILWVVGRSFGPGLVPTSGGGAGGQERTILHAWLYGKVITMIRLHVNSFEIGPGCCGFFECHINATWEFYGDAATPIRRSTWGQLKSLYRAEGVSH